MIGLDYEREAGLDQDLSQDDPRSWEWLPYMTNKFSKFQARELFESEFEKLGAELI
jgi:hypothetical protein